MCDRTKDLYFLACKNLNSSFSTWLTHLILEVSLHSWLLWPTVRRDRHWVVQQQPHRCLLQQFSTVGKSSKVVIRLGHPNPGWYLHSYRKLVPLPITGWFWTPFEFWLMESFNSHIRFTNFTNTKANLSVRTNLSLQLPPLGTLLPLPDEKRKVIMPRRNMLRLFYFIILYSPNLL